MGISETKNVKKKSNRDYPLRFPNSLWFIIFGLLSYNNVLISTFQLLEGRSRLSPCMIFNPLKFSNKENAVSFDNSRFSKTIDLISFINVLSNLLVKRHPTAVKIYAFSTVLELLETKNAIGFDFVLFWKSGLSDPNQLDPFNKIKQHFCVQ